MIDFFRRLNRATVIVIAAVLTATPRWVVALLASEGYGLPAGLAQVWPYFSALSAIGMAIVEGAAFEYVFAEYRREQTPRRARFLMGLVVASGVTFVAMLVPPLSASIAGVTVREALTWSWVSVNWPVVAWSAVVASSTILIVGSVGYAQKPTVHKAPAAPVQEKPQKFPAPEIESAPGTPVSIMPYKNDPRIPPTRAVFFSDMRAGKTWTRKQLVEAGIKDGTAKAWIGEWNKEKRAIEPVDVRPG